MNKRKIEVVRHALILFQEKGINQTSIQDIIERSGISKGTFYNYFKSKNECINAALEHIRYKASLIRSEIQLGKRSDDLDVLIEQVVQISHHNQQSGLPNIFEEMMVSTDRELKQYVSLFRWYELDWFANRLVNVYGESLRPYSFEASVLFFGMLHHLKFAAYMLEQNQLPGDTRTIVGSLFHYMNFIIDSLINKNTSCLNQQHYAQILETLNIEKLNSEDVVEKLTQFKVEQTLTKHQDELITSLIEELGRTPLRTFVINAILPSFVEAFNHSHLYDDARHLHTKVWKYLNHK